MLSYLSLHQFRGHIDIELPLSPYTAVIGENGSGKTHILEALHIACGGNFAYLQSHRDDGSMIEIRERTDMGEKSFSLERKEGKDTYRIQGSKTTGLKYKENLPIRTVFVSPFDMNLWYFAPSMRRDYLDNLLARSFAQFHEVKKKYDTILRQRNALLKSIREGEGKRDDLEYWDQIFCEHALIYHAYRRKWRDFVREKIHILLSFLPKYDLDLHFDSRLDTYEGEKSSLEHFIGDSREQDILSGHTHIGPHLDDFGFIIRSGEEEMESHFYLSRGENKVLLLALKQIEILFLKKYRDKGIILLFDDIFAELDSRYADEVITLFQADQVILTTQRQLPEGGKWSHFSCINLQNR